MNHIAFLWRIQLARDQFMVLLPIHFVFSQILYIVFSQVLHIQFCQVLSYFIGFIQMSQFNIKHGSLNLVHSRIPTLVIEYVFAGTSVIAQCPDYFSQFFIICGYGTRIAQSTQVLAGIKTVGGSIAQTSCPLAVFTVDATVRLCIVFKKQ